MKTAISIPDEVFRRAERAAKRLGISRSELYTKAITDFLGVRRDSAITASYDEAFGANEDDIARFRRANTTRQLLAVEWDDEQ
jgi:predicted transcriptional regulator